MGLHDHVEKRQSGIESKCGSIPCQILALSWITRQTRARSMFSHDNLFLFLKKKPWRAVNNKAISLNMLFSIRFIMPQSSDYWMNRYNIQLAILFRASFKCQLLWEWNYYQANSQGRFSF
jgi:hypothetical protein